MRDVLALLDVCVCSVHGTCDEFVVDPSAVDVSLLGAEVDRVDLRGSIDGDALGAGVVLVVVDDVGVVLVGAFSETCGCVVGVGLGVGSRSLPMRARSCFVDCRNRLCIFGLLMFMSSCTGEMCRSTSRRSICSASPSE